MPFSSVADPVDLARAEAALNSAWAKVEPEIAEEQREAARTRLAYIVASYVLVASDEDELAARALERFRSKTD